MATLRLVSTSVAVWSNGAALPVTWLWRSELAPGGVPTMVVSGNAYSLAERGALESIASKLAPTLMHAGFVTFVEASYAIHLGIPCTMHRVRRTG